MNTPADQTWSQDNVDPMIQMTNELDDLSTIFNIDNFDLDALPSIDDNFGGQIQQSQPATHSNSPFDDTFGGLGAPAGTVAHDFGGQNDFGMSNTTSGQQQFMPQIAPSGGNMQFGADSMFQPSMPQQYNTQQYGYPSQQNFFPGQHVPPTPNSFDLHGESGRFMQQQADAQQRAMLEQQYQLRKNEHIQFTPMASPSGTPQFHMNPEYTVPGAYFSPLTSPALHAQNSAHMHQQFPRQHQQGYYTNSSTAPSSAAPSPLDPNGDVEMGGDGMTLPEPAAPPKRSTRKKAATPRSLAMSKMKQSPIQKAQKRKSGSVSSGSLSKDMAASLQNGQRSTKLVPDSAGLQIPRGLESSENDSVSPEALCDALMGPPPKPASSMSQSPALNGQQKQQQASNGGPAATPNSLLSTKSSQQALNNPSSHANSSQDPSQISLDDFQLPEAASNHPDQPSHRPSLSHLETQLPPASSNEETPRLSARKTPKLGALSTPSSARPLSATASPSIAPSPLTASTPAVLLKDKPPDQKPSRGRGSTTRKRGSVSASTSTLASPALRPRISPSIKPLLPEGTPLSSPTHALLLASKSNYQNLLDNTPLPGVSYPASLSTNLTSKRTSHKVAEQGRRNRINDALKEMQSLIPAFRDEAQEVEGEKGGSSSSKAATVEAANRYLRVLREREEALRGVVGGLREEVEGLRRLVGGGKEGEDGGREGEGGEAMDEEGEKMDEVAEAETGAAPS